MSNTTHHSTTLHALVCFSARIKGVFGEFWHTAWKQRLHLLLVEVVLDMGVDEALLDQSLVGARSIFARSVKFNLWTGAGLAGMLDISLPTSHFQPLSKCCSKWCSELLVTS